MAALTSLENSSKRSFGKHLTMLGDKHKNLNHLMNVCDQSIAKLKASAQQNLDLFHRHRDEQVKEILEKYNDMESRLVCSSEKVVEELSGFIDQVVRPQRNKVERANELLQKAVSARKPEGILKLGKDVEDSLMKIINADLPELFLSRLLEPKNTGELCRDIEVELVDSCGLPFLGFKNVENLQGCEGDAPDASVSSISNCVSESETYNFTSDQLVQLTLNNSQPTRKQRENIKMRVKETVTRKVKEKLNEKGKVEPLPSVESQLVSFSESICQSRFSGNSTHLAQAGNQLFVVESFTPSIYTINDQNQANRHIPIDSSFTVVGMAASRQYIYVHFMDVTEYLRVIHVYGTDGQLISKLDTPNLLGASLALVNTNLVISSRDKLTLCSTAGEHIKDIPQNRRCIRKLSAFADTDCVIMTCCSNNQVVKLDIESEQVCWAVSAIPAPAASSCDQFGRVYVLVKPSDICVLNGETGDLLTRATLSCSGGIMEDIYVTENGLLMTATNHATSSKHDPNNHTVIDTYRIEDVYKKVDAIKMKAPKGTGESGVEPQCLTDGSNEPLPRDYIQRWKVTDGNKEQRVKEIIYTMNLIKSKSMEELITNSKSYERDFYLLCKGMFRAHNNKYANRQLVLQTLLDGDVMDFLIIYWNAVIAEFELKRKEAEESLKIQRKEMEESLQSESDETVLPPKEEEGAETIMKHESRETVEVVIDVGHIWEYYTANQRHIVDSLLNCYNLLVIIWNGTDMKIDETLKFLYDGIVGFVLQNLDAYLYPLHADGNHPQHKVVTACIGVIHNFCHKYSGCIADLKQRNALRIIAQYRNSGKSSLKIKSILTSSYLLSEKDVTNSAVIELDESDITVTAKILRDALNSPNVHSRKYGYHADELIVGLNNIAVVECNKKRLVDAGVLPLFVEALSKNKPELQESAARGIWTLAFDDASMKRIKDEPGCMDELRKLATDCDVPSVKSAANGALWKIEGETKHLQKLTTKESSDVKSPTKKLKHIMISYQWDMQPEVLRIRQRLKEEGYRVWIDVEHMSGSTLQAMARAVEHSAVIVPVLTEKYKASPACRQEAEYAHHLHKKLVPVRLQPKYRPDGWLGFMLGSTFFYDLANKSVYESKIQDFIKAVGDDAKILPGEDENPVTEYDEDDSELTAVNPLITTVAAPQHPTLQQTDVLNTQMKPIFDVSSLACLSWSFQRVNEWLTTHKLDKFIPKLTGLDGQLLAELISMRFTSPDVYYDLMGREHEMRMLDLLRLNAAIRQLVNAP